ncbi:helix-turn-helix domain-containing protein [Burkholderia cepacia]|uniref:helix-turn-helix domain-containing protein n=1 Tax=Burkholderia cepacia TaxID=292 RepID=UPI0009BEB0C0|nr:helix-turn-helix domain-containing protein [Burkholderia cepacia]
MTVLDIPRDVFGIWVGPWRYRGLVKIDRRDGITSWAAEQLYALIAEPHELTQDACERQAKAALDLVRLMMRLRDGDMSITKSTAHTLSRAKAFIESQLGDYDLDCDAVSRAINLSSRQLARVFELEGMPLARYILTRRLEHYRNDLRDRSLRHLTVGEIAFRWGFSNQAHFSRTYRARFGETPSESRAPVEAR